MTINELIGALEAILGRSADRQHTDPRAGDIRLSFADTRLAARELGWRAQIPFEDGLARTVAWFQDRDASG